MNDATNTDEKLIECAICASALNGKTCWMVILARTPDEVSTVCEACYDAIIEPEDEEE